MALKYGTDKGGHHEYCEAYELFFSWLRDKKFNMIEFGIGGAENPTKGGASLRMWFEYFWKANIYALDIHPKTFNQPRTFIYHGSQGDPSIIQSMVAHMGEKPRIIIDDASHINELTIKTFFIAFPLLAPGGIYVVEDVHTSYWSELYGGGKHPNTVMNLFKRATDLLNSEHWALNEDEYEFAVKWKPLTDHIESITFYKEIIFIRKKV